MTAPVASRIAGKIICPATDSHPRHSEASAVSLNDGRILLAWSRFASLNRNSGDAQTARDPSGLPGTALESDNAYAEIACLTSADGGDTWDEMRVMIANDAGLNVMSPSLARLADGGLGLVYSQRHSTARASRIFRRSDDEGRTWSAPVPITHEGYMTGCNDRLRALGSGRLVTPLHCTDDWRSHYLYTRVAWSDDHGQRWQIGPPLTLPRVEGSGESGCWEGDIAERGDGSLLLVMRTAMGTLFRAESHDRGETWRDLRSLEVVAPVAPGIIRRIPGTDHLLLIWNWHYDWREPMGGVRRPLAAAISTDGGASWPAARRTILEDDPRFTYSYPACLFIGDHVLVTYYVSAADDPFGSRSLKALRVPLRRLYDA